MSGKESWKYEDMINLPHHTSVCHPRMSLYERAAQFSPFAALTGYEEAVQETARLTEERREPDEDVRERMDETLCMLRNASDTEISVTITYFEPDARKEGGAYRQKNTVIKKVDGIGHAIVLSDGTVIPAEQIWNIEKNPESGQE